MWIGIAGKKRGGKDTVAQMLKEAMPTYFTIDHLARPIKEIAKIFGFEDKDYNDYWNITGREFLQKVGTDFFRNQFDKNVWVKLFQYTQRANHLIIPDIRFDNECHICDIVIKVEGRGESDTHESEAGISEADYIIYNTGTLKELRARVLEIANDIT